MGRWSQGILIRCSNHLKKRPWSSQCEGTAVFLEWSPEIVEKTHFAQLYPQSHLWIQPLVQDVHSSQVVLEKDPSWASWWFPTRICSHTSGETTRLIITLRPKEPWYLTCTYEHCHIFFMVNPWQVHKSNNKPSLWFKSGRLFLPSSLFQVTQSLPSWSFISPSRLWNSLDGTLSRTPSTHSQNEKYSGLFFRA